MSRHIWKPPIYLALICLNNMLHTGRWGSGMVLHSLGWRGWISHRIGEKALLSMDAKLAWIPDWLEVNFLFIRHLPCKEEKYQSGWDFSTQKHTTCPSVPGYKFPLCGLIEEIGGWGLHIQTLDLQVFPIKIIILPILSDIVDSLSFSMVSHPNLYPFSLLLHTPSILCLVLGQLRKFVIVNKKKISRPYRRLWNERSKLVHLYCCGLSRPEFYIFLCIFLF